MIVFSAHAPDIFFKFEIAYTSAIYSTGSVNVITEIFISVKVKGIGLISVQNSIIVVGCFKSHEMVPVETGGGGEPRNYKDFMCFRLHSIYNYDEMSRCTFVSSKGLDYRKKTRRY